MGKVKEEGRNGEEEMGYPIFGYVLLCSYDVLTLSFLKCFLCLQIQSVCLLEEQQQQQVAKQVQMCKWKNSSKK